MRSNKVFSYLIACCLVGATFSFNNCAPVSPHSPETADQPSLDVGANFAAPDEKASVAQLSSRENVPSPDEIANSKEEINKILDLWSANWNKTTPRGKKNSDVRVLGYKGPELLGLDLQRRDFSKLPGVIVRGAGELSEKGSQARIRGVVNLNSSKNISLMLFEIYGGGKPIRLYGTRDVTIARNWIKGSSTRYFKMDGIPMAPGITLTKEDIDNDPDFKSTLQFARPMNLTIRDNIIEYFRNTGLQIGLGGDNLTIEGNVWGLGQHDNIKIQGGPWSPYRNLRVARNYFLGLRSAKSAADDPDATEEEKKNGYHEDCVQITGAKIIGGYFGYNISVLREWKNYSSGAHQVFFIAAKASLDKVLFEQNFIVGNNGGIKFKSDAGFTADVKIRHNTILAALDGVTTVALELKGRRGTNSKFNAGAVGVFGSHPLGQDALQIVVGQPAQASKQEMYFSGEPSRKAQISAYLPAKGQQTHWLSKDPRGAYLLLKDIFALGKHAENDAPWPAGVAFRAQLNKDNGLAKSRYTGKFNDDGGNL